MRHVHTVRVGPYGFRVGSDWRAPVAALERLYAGYPKPDGVADFTVRLEATRPWRRVIRPSVAIAGDWTLPEAAPLPLAHALLAAEMGMNLQLALGGRRHLLLHASSVERDGHELRTPLASILGFIETLSDEAGADPDVRARFLKVMFDEARRMQRLVEDLISLSRIEAEKHQLPGDAVDLRALIAEVRAEIFDMGDDRGHAVALQLEPDAPPVVGDRARLSQMLHNLIGNAIKYGRPGTPVTVALRREGGMVRLAVTDEGEGIAPEHIPRLTERFYRIDAGRSRTLGGTGLGLAIVKHIVERHRGRLDIASKAGVGTTVTVLLPPADQPVTNP